MAFTLRSILNKIGIKKSEDDAQGFITDKMKDARSGKGKGNKPKIGQMFTYGYIPKWKDQLPFYDIVPLVMVIDIKKDGFLGLNFHYLSPKLRVLLLLQLIKVSGNTRLKANMKLKVTYNLLKHASGHKLYKPTIKRYLYSQLKSPLINIDSDQWENVILLPSAKFRKANEAEVYKWAMKQI